jgi:Radical SAM superfamily
MAAIALSALFQHLDQGPLLTFVLPGGCNLGCGFCFIANRGERLQEAVLQPDQYREFVADICRHHRLGGVAVVGDEPLIDAAWPSTRAILSAARSASVPSAIITNGTLLAGRVAELADMALSALLISLDAAGSAHDRLRKRSGAYQAILDGLTSLSDYPALRSNTAVATIAFPGRMDLLGTLPALLSQKAIRRWLVSPLLGFAEREPARLHPRLARQLRDYLPALYAQACSHGVELRVDDVLGSLPDEVFSGPASVTRLMRHGKQALSLLRMAPDGRVAHLANVLDPLTPELPRWNGIEMAHRFLERTGLMPIQHRALAA